MPKKTRIRDVHYSPTIACWNVILEHRSFDEVPEGATIPVSDIQIEIIDEGEDEEN